MKRLRINFLYLDLWMEVGAAVPELNPVYAAMFLVNQRPYSLALSLGRFSEQQARRLLARTYSEAVILKSSVQRSPAQWEEWLLANDWEFDQLRAMCEHAPNFEVQDDGAQLEQPGPPDAGGSGAA